MNPCFVSWMDARTGEHLGPRSLLPLFNTLLDFRPPIIVGVLYVAAAAKSKTSRIVNVPFTVLRKHIQGKAYSWILIRHRCHLGVDGVHFQQPAGRKTTEQSRLCTLWKTGVVLSNLVLIHTELFFYQPIQFGELVRQNMRNIVIHVCNILQVLL